MASIRKPRRSPRKTASKAAPRKRKPAPRKGGAPRRKPARKAVAAASPAPQENPAAHQLAQRIARMVLDRKASDVVVLDVRGLTSYADYFVIASGDSERQV